MTPRDLTAEEIAELTKEALRAAEFVSTSEVDIVWMRSGTSLSLLAMASRLLELEAAIEFLNTRGVWQNTRPEGIRQTARDYGFPGLNAKGGESG